MFRSWFSVLMIVLGLSAAAAFAADAPKLQWDANDDADYYVVYWSKDPDSFTEENSLEVPADETYLELTASPGGEEYYYSIKAFNECGNSSDFSDVIVSAHLPLALYGGTAGKSSSGTATTAAGSGGGGSCFIGSLFSGV